MTRVAGVFFLLVGLYAALLESNPNAGGFSNLKDVANNQGRYGIITVGVGLLIISGGIDLSIGSMFGLGAVVFGLLMRGGIHPYLALVLTVGMGAIAGLGHGLLVTRLKLQPFLVTLCGLFVYRGIAKSLSARSIGLSEVKGAQPDFAGTIDSLRFALIGEDPKSGLVFPGQFVILIVLTLIAAILLHKSVYGRYWYAIGFNERAAQYSGIAVNRNRVAAFIISAALAAFGGVLYLLATSDANPDTAGNSYELYAITGAVLGGCSLRGGEGTAIGIFLGAMVLPVLNNLLVFRMVPDSYMPIVIGMTLLFGTLIDEIFRRRGRRAG